MRLPKTRKKRTRRQLKTGIKTSATSGNTKDEDWLDSVVQQKWTVRPSKELKRYRKRLRRACHDELAQCKVVSWNEDTTEFASQLVIDAESFSVDPVFDTPPAKLEHLANRNRYAVSPNETFAYQNRICHVGTPLQLHGHGYAFFTDDVTLPTLIDLNRDSKGTPFSAITDQGTRVALGNIWMSVTPNEVMSQRSGIEAAEGTVVVGGLGLGWFVRKVCEKACVERVIVVEQSQELLDWYGYDLCAKHSKVSDVICDDIYNQLGSHGSDATYLLDIWPTQEAVNSDQRFIHWKSNFGERLWGWGWHDDPADRKMSNVAGQMSKWPSRTGRSGLGIAT